MERGRNAWKGNGAAARIAYAVVDLTFNGTLATDSGALVQVQGFVKGTTF